MPIGARRRSSAIARVAAFGLACSVLADAGTAPEAATADAIYTNGLILALDAGHSEFAAMAVSDGRIAALGTERALRRLKGPRTVVHDLAGKTVLPGFVDAHGHFPGSVISREILVDLNSPPIGTVRGIDGLLARLAERERALPIGAWLQGVGYDDTLLAERRHPTRDDLDRVSKTRPIFVTHVSGHLAVANTAALALAGIDRATPSPAGGRIRHDAAGDPTGILEESALGLVSSKLPPLPQEQFLEAIRKASLEYASMGVTTAQNGAATVDSVRLALQAATQGELGVRLNFWLVSPDMKKALAGEAIVPADQGMVAVTGAKQFADGSIQGYTAYLTQPYYVPPHGDQDYRGYPRMQRDSLAAAILEFHRARVRVAVHANGDAAIDDVLDAIEAAQQKDPWPDARHVVVHAQMARDDQLVRMAGLGVIPSFFILHTYYWGDRHRDLFIGPERAAHISPARSALEQGLRITLHSDTPVTPMNPLMMVWAAVNRETSGGKTLGPNERIGILQALEGVTINAAYQERQEASRGSLEVGKLADFVILDANPLRVDPLKIRNIRVLQTVVGGRTVFRSRTRDARRRNSRQSALAAL